MRRLLRLKIDNFESEQRGLYEKACREGKEGLMVQLYYNLNNKRNKNKNGRRQEEQWSRVGVRQRNFSLCDT